MNSSWTVLATAFLLIGVLVAEARVKSADSVIGFASKKDFMFSVRSIYSFLDPVLLSKTKSINIPAIQPKALNDFRIRYGHPGGEIWFQVPGGYISYYRTAESEHRVFYTKKGRWEYSLTFYQENKLTKAILALIKSNYYDYRIIIIEELTNPEGTNYIVHLENESSIKHLRISKIGEMELINDYSKSEQTISDLVMA